MSTCMLVFWIYIFRHLCVSGAIDYPELDKLSYKRNPAPDGHRYSLGNYSIMSSDKFTLFHLWHTAPSTEKCGVCPTYFQKICAFDFLTNNTFIFDNHCVMDLYNCIEGTEFVPLKYENCLYFGNFGYVHGFKFEDMDYGENHVKVINTKKNPDYVRRAFKKIL